MLQVKMFCGMESHLGDLETDVNTWIADNKVTVVDIKGNISPQTTRAESSTSLSSGGSSGRRFNPSDVFVLVTYEAPDPA